MYLRWHTKKKRLMKNTMPRDADTMLQEAVMISFLDLMLRSSAPEQASDQPVAMHKRECGDARPMTARAPIKSVLTAFR